MYRALSPPNGPKRNCVRDGDLQQTIYNENINLSIMNISRFIFPRTPFAAAVAVLAIASAMPAMAADEVTITGTTTYYDDGNHSRKDCERLAAEQARIDALAKKFGTIVAQDILQSDRIRNDVESNDFLALSSTEVRGIWLGDLVNPVYKYALDSDGNYVVECTVKGKASEITNQATEFDAMVLRNKPDKQAVDNRFRSGDAMYLYFKGPCDGYVAVFLKDESNNVIQLVPYSSSSDNQMKLRKNRDYILFSPAHREKDVYSEVPELNLTAFDQAEYNRLYVMFSPDVFSMPPMTFNGDFSCLTYEEFAKWVAKVRRNDPRMGIKNLNLQIEPKQ